MFTTAAMLLSTAAALGAPPVCNGDVADASTDVFLAGDVDAFATGEMKQRPILTGNPSGFTIKVASRGILTDASGGEWAVNAFLKQVFQDAPDPVQDIQRLSARAV